MARLVTGMVLLACSISSCQGSQPAPEGAKVVNESRDAQVNRPPIADVLRDHSASLMSIPGVVGTGEGRAGDRPVFVIFVVRRTRELERRLPDRLEGYAVEIREAGEVTAPPR